MWIWGRKSVILALNQRKMQILLKKCRKNLRSSEKVRTFASAIKK